MKFGAIAWISMLVCGVNGIIVTEETDVCLPPGSNNCGRRLNDSFIRSDKLPTDIAECDPVGNKFTVNLVVLSHLYFLLEPTTEAAATGCRPFLIHADYDFEAKANAKSAIRLDHDLADWKAEVNMVDFGTYGLSEIISAYDSATVDAPGHDGMDYEYLFNNCSDFLASFLGQLGYEASPHETDLVADLLSFAAPQSFMEKMRAEAASKEVDVPVQDMSDAELLHWLVAMRLAPLYNEN